MMNQTLQLLGVHPVRSKPNQLWAVELTKANMAGVAEWITENGGTAVIQYDDEVPVMWVGTTADHGSKLASIGDVVMRGTVGEFYAITKEVFSNRYEDVPQEG